MAWPTRGHTIRMPHSKYERPDTFSYKETITPATILVQAERAGCPRSQTALHIRAKPQRTQELPLVRKTKNALLDPGKAPPSARIAQLSSSASLAAGASAKAARGEASSGLARLAGGVIMIDGIGGGALLGFTGETTLLSGEAAELDATPGESLEVGDAGLSIKTETLTSLYSSAAFGCSKAESS